jgi:hypothetical protein
LPTASPVPPQALIVMPGRVPGINVFRSLYQVDSTSQRPANQRMFIPNPIDGGP